MLDYIFQMNYANILIAIFLTIIIITDRAFEKRVRNLFLISLLSLIVLVIADSTDYYLANQAYDTPLRFFTTAIGYSLRPAVIFFLSRVIKRRLKHFHWIFSVPLIINVVLVFSSLFTHLVFYIDIDTVFVRGPLGCCPFVTSGIYLIIMLIWTIQEFKKNSTAELVIIFIIALISIISTILETLFKYKFLLNNTISVSLLCYYLFLHMQIYKRDSLTGLLNRRNFYLEANDNSNSDMIVVNIDINNLKHINDNYGHSKGDLAISTVACTLKDSLLSGCSLYRTGGDEFMMLCRQKNTQQVLNMLAEATDKLSQTDYSIAYGLAEYSPGMDFETVCLTADERMYENKHICKKQLNTI